MKHKIFLIAFVILLAGSFTSCDNDLKRDYPILYVVNGTDYSVDVYCDNFFVVSVGAHDNSDKVELSNTSINLPVYVEADFYDSKGKKVNGYNWSNQYFRWNRSYKMTLTNSTKTSSITAL